MSERIAVHPLIFSLMDDKQIEDVANEKWCLKCSNNEIEICECEK